MHDIKNISLALGSSVSAILAALDVKSVVTILSAIVLPTLFFAIGKGVDVGLQFYFRLREEQRSQFRESAEQTAIRAATGGAKRDL